MKSDQDDTQLFLLRIWPGEASEGQGDEGPRPWRGKLQHVVRGEAHAFVGLEMMIDCLEAMLCRDQEEGQKEELPSSQNGRD